MSTFDNAFFSIIDDGAAKLPFPTGKIANTFFSYFFISFFFISSIASKNIKELPKKYSYYNRLRKKLFF